MIARRDLLIGGACVAALGASAALKPQRRVSLLGTDSLDAIVPRAFGPWSSHDVSDLVAPKTEDSLAGRLYGQVVGRVYRREEGGAEIMMLLAHGDTQSDTLQLHRPEACYPAFGFAISNNRPIRLALSDKVRIPARQLIATAPGRQECILYWSRLGNSLPVDSGEQRMDRLRTAMQGFIADGLLGRFSIASSDAPRAFAALDAFVPQLLAAVAPGKRPILVGEQLGAALADR